VAHEALPLLLGNFIKIKRYHFNIITIVMCSVFRPRYVVFWAQRKGNRTALSGSLITPTRSLPSILTKDQITATPIWNPLGSYSQAAWSPKTLPWVSEPVTTPTSYPVTMQGSLHAQGLCTACSLCLEHSFPRCQCGSFHPSLRPQDKCHLVKDDLLCHLSPL
jgi:hypothetical protein